MAATKRSYGTRRTRPIGVRPKCAKTASRSGIDGDTMSWRAFRNGLQTVHLWAGLILSIPFILIGITGSLIVLIDGFADFSLPSASKGEPQSLQRIYEAAKAAAPAGWSVAALVMPSREGQAVGAQLQL